MRCYLIQPLGVSSVWTFWRTKDICSTFWTHVGFGYTYLETQVREAVNKTVAELTAWSLKHAAAGTAPLVGFYGEPFQKGSFRASLAGKQLAGGFKFLVWQEKFSQFFDWRHSEGYHQTSYVCFCWEWTVTLFLGWPIWSSRRISKQGSNRICFATTTNVATYVSNAKQWTLGEQWVIVLHIKIWDLVHLMQQHA